MHRWSVRAVQTLAVGGTNTATGTTAILQLDMLAVRSPLNWVHTRTFTAGSHGPSVARRHDPASAASHHPPAFHMHTPSGCYTKATSILPSASSNAHSRVSKRKLAMVVPHLRTNHWVAHLYIPIPHNRSSVSPSFEMELMQKAEAEIQKKIEASFNEKITLLVASLTDKQSGFTVSLVSKSESTSWSQATPPSKPTSL